MTVLDDTVTPDPIWAISLARGEDGYTAMDTARTLGWVPLPAWGTRGIDLGTWPYVIIFIRWNDNAFDLVEYVEGDVRQWRLPTREQLDAALGELAGLWTQSSNQLGHS